MQNRLLQAFKRSQEPVSVSVTRAHKMDLRSHRNMRQRQGQVLFSKYFLPVGITGTPDCGRASPSLARAFALTGVFVPEFLQKIHFGRVAAAYRMCYDEVQNFKRSDKF